MHLCGTAYRFLHVAAMRHGEPNEQKSSIWTNVAYFALSLSSPGANKSGVISIASKRWKLRFSKKFRNRIALMSPTKSGRSWSILLYICRTFRNDKSRPALDQADNLSCGDLKQVGMNAMSSLTTFRFIFSEAIAATENLFISGSCTGSRFRQPWFAAAGI